MESKHDVLTNMTIGQALTQQVESVNDHEKELKTKKAKQHPNYAN